MKSLYKLTSFSNIYVTSSYPGSDADKLDSPAPNKCVVHIELNIERNGNLARVETKYNFGRYYFIDTETGKITLTRANKHPIPYFVSLPSATITSSFINDTSIPAVIQDFTNQLSRSAAKLLNEKD